MSEIISIEEMLLGGCIDISYKGNDMIFMYGDMSASLDVFQYGLESMNKTLILEYEGYGEFKVEEGNHRVYMNGIGNISPDRIKRLIPLKSYFEEKNEIQYPHNKFFTIVHIPGVIELSDNIIALRSDVIEFIKIIDALVG